jgi:hypothetical protein
VKKKKKKKHLLVGERLDLEHQISRITAIYGPICS